jgi:hypothetical protein
MWPIRPWFYNQLEAEWKIHLNSPHHVIRKDAQIQEEIRSNSDPDQRSSL